MCISVLYISEKEPCIYPQKGPLYIRKRSMYISTKETFILPKNLTDICAYAQEIDRALKRERERDCVTDRAREQRKKEGGEGAGGENTKRITGPTRFQG